MTEKKTVGEALSEHLKAQPIPPHKGGDGVWYDASKEPPFKKYLTVTLSDPLLFITVQPIEAGGIPQTVLHLGYYDANNKFFCEKHGEDISAYQDTVRKWYMFPMPPIEKPPQ